MVPVILTILSVVLMLIDCVSGASVFRWVNLARGYFFALRSFHLVNNKNIASCPFQDIALETDYSHHFLRDEQSYKTVGGSDYLQCIYARNLI